MGFILDKKILADVSNSLRDRGDKVVLTHGAFDLFHVGHFELLKRSKKKGDVLIVGIESDDRIKRYKGSLRPIIPFNERMQLVSALNCVDFVLPITGDTFSEEYYLALYDLFNPNIVTFGRRFSWSKGIQKISKSVVNTEFKLIGQKFNKKEVSTSEIITRVMRSGEL